MVRTAGAESASGAARVHGGGHPDPHAPVLWPHGHVERGRRGLRAARRAEPIRCCARADQGCRGGRGPALGGDGRLRPDVRELAGAAQRRARLHRGAAENVPVDAPHGVRSAAAPLPRPPLRPLSRGHPPPKAAVVRPRLGSARRLPAPLLAGRRTRGHRTGAHARGRPCGHALRHLLRHGTDVVPLAPRPRDLLHPNVHLVAEPWSLSGGAPPCVQLPRH
mmetsp:Transcript_66620/g.198255  ORF Transcript_66620/g.198255 Transcript_66620/m.198255 type:complete len:221 (+) Transcript_66620:244-906(+)